MKQLGLVLVLMLVLCTLAIAACGGDGEEAIPAATQTPAATEISGGTAAPFSEAEAGLFDNFKFKMEYSSTDGSSGTYEYWGKDGKWKVDISGQVGGQGYQQIMMDDGECAYIYTPASNKATRYPSGSMMAAHGLAYMETLETTYNDYASEGALQAYCDEDPGCLSFAKRGTETIAGHKCDIWECVLTDGTNKVWVATDTGWPLKIETTSGGVTMTMEHTELDMNPNIPDSVFQIPPGVNITDSDTHMPGGVGG